METLTHLQVGDIVYNLISGERMTVVHISLDPLSAQDLYHCTCFYEEYFVKENLFLKKEIRVLSTLENREPKMNTKDRVQLNHLLDSLGPIMEIVDIVEKDKIQFAICKWQRIDQKPEADIFPVLALKKVE